MENSYTIKELHELFLVMIKDFHKYCVNNGLTYYMVGGTLLGAAREKGFIPWDDDVDFAMPRPDYEKFISGCNLFRIEHLGRDKHYLFPFAKVFNSELPIVKINDKEWNVNSTLFLKFDLYPIDGVGQNIKKARNHAAKVQQLRNICYLNQSKDKSSSIIKRFITRCVRAIPSHWLLYYQNKKMSQYEYSDSSLVTRWRMPSLLDNVVPKDTYEPAVLLPFEDTRLFAPAKYDWYLRKVYGDYMQPHRENNGLRHDTNANDISSQFIGYLNKNI